MWLKDLLPEDVPNARILSYGYDVDTHSFAQTSSQTIFRHAEAFVEDLSMLRTEPKRPIIFLAHNLGGIILKKALNLCNIDSFESEHEYRDILVSTLAVLFFGTPHSGADVVQLADWMRRLFSVYMYTNNRIIADLKRDSSELEDIQRLYLPASGHFKTIFFHEEYVTPIVGGKPELIVPRPLAVIQGDGKAKPVLLHANHPQLIKYTGKEDVNYRKVVGYLSKLLKNPTTNHLSQPSIRQPQKFQTTVEINTPLFD
ncbi:hypothetical protein FRC20_004639 [Serendipita sp. 405]|nr:hypothetical protein FRC15_004710 [Serendipita sp. 397]KAG8776590.1 hypothetical protein FRC16_004478 [Serendipita sp. 398]KAG8842087.1 hypothetical protein FRC20_004639 [Serendipita sp. 405]